MLQKILFAILKSNKKRLLVMAAGVVALVVVAVLLFGAIFNRLDVRKYIKIDTADSFEGNGFANISLDYVALAEALKMDNFEDIRTFRDLEDEGLATLSELTESEESRRAIEEEYGLDLAGLYDLGRSVEITAENNDGKLSNGDVVSVTAKINKGAKFKKRLTGGKLKHKISGLKALFPVEPLIIPAFLGNSSQGKIVARASLDPSLGDWVNGIYFTCAYSSNDTLSNGDVVTVTATVDDYEAASKLAQQYGYGIKESYVAEFTIVGLALEDRTATE